MVLNTLALSSLPVIIIIIIILSFVLVSPVLETELRAFSTLGNCCTTEPQFGGKMVILFSVVSVIHNQSLSENHKWNIVEITSSKVVNYKQF